MEDTLQCPLERALLGSVGLQQCLRDTVDALHNSFYYIHIVKAADRVGQSRNINDMDVAGGLKG